MLNIISSACLLWTSHLAFNGFFAFFVCLQFSKYALDDCTFNKLMSTSFRNHNIQQWTFDVYFIFTPSCAFQIWHEIYLPMRKELHKRKAINSFRRLFLRPFVRWWNRDKCTVLNSTKAEFSHSKVWIYFRKSFLQSPTPTHPLLMWKDTEIREAKKEIN